jgi:ketosteroid isomerase-like protein
MSQEDVEQVRRSFEALERGGVEAILDQIHPEFEMTPPPELAVEPDTYRGHDGLRRYFAAFDGVMENVRFVPDELIDAGDERVVAMVRLVARSPSTDLEFEQSVAQVWTLRDGRAIHLDAYATREEALRAVGLPA